MKSDKKLSYKGRPLIRSGNTIYYGDMTDPYVAVLQLIDSKPQKEFKDLELPARVTVQILSTNESLPPLERIKRNTEKNSFYDGIKFAAVWLERILEDETAADAPDDD